MAKTRAMQNREIRQNNLRQWLSEKCTAQHLVNNLEKIEALDPESECFNNELNKYRVANEQRLKVLNKYLPDLKAQEIRLEAEVVTKKASELSDDELASIISSVDDE
jgi:hypothetical protein